MDYLNKFKRYLSEEELEETNVTGNIDGGEGPPKTPYAFDGGRKEDEEKKKKNATTSTGYEMVKDSLYKKMMSMIHETGVINETSYRDYKKDPTSTPANTMKPANINTIQHTINTHNLR